MNNINIKCKKLNGTAKLPTYGSEFAAGADLYSNMDDLVINPGETKFIGTGLAFEIPEGYAGFIYARSSFACKRNLAPANKVGVIDSDYRGEIKIALHNNGKTPQVIEKNERIAQIVFTEYYKASFEEVDVLNETVRGEGGFGSTGKN